MKTAEENESIYVQGFEMGVTYVFTAIFLHFENGQELVDSLKAFMDPELDKKKAH